MIKVSPVKKHDQFLHYRYTLIALGFATMIFIAFYFLVCRHKPQHVMHATESLYQLYTFVHFYL